MLRPCTSIDELPPLLQRLDNLQFDNRGRMVINHQSRTTLHHLLIRRPLRIFSSTGEMFDTFLPPLSRDWIQAGLRLDDDDEVEEVEQIWLPNLVLERQTNVRARGKDRKRSCKLYRALNCRRLGTKLASIARSALHLPDTALRDARIAIRNCKSKFLRKAQPLIINGNDPRRVTQYFQYESDLPRDAFLHDRTFPEEILDRRYAFARLLGVIGNDPAPMPALECQAQVGPWYREFERQNREAQVYQTNVIDLNLQQRIDHDGSQAQRVCNAIFSLSARVEELDDTSSQIDLGEGPSTGPVRALRRTERVDLDAWREANEYSGDEEAPQPEALTSEARYSSMADTTEQINTTESDLTSSGTQRQAPDSEPVAQHISVDSRLHELHELEERRKTELREEIAGIGSGIIVQDEFQPTHSPSMSESSSQWPIQETLREFVFPEAIGGPEIVDSARNDENLDRHRVFEENPHHKDNPLRASFHHRPEASDDHLVKPVAVLRRPEFLGTSEEEMLVRKDLQRLNKRVVQGRGAFAREDGVHEPKPGMPIDIALFT